MPRIARVTYPGGFYHIFNRSLHRGKIFLEDNDYHYFLDKLAELISGDNWTVYAYCLMPNHYHLLIEEKSTSISKLMGRLLTSYGVYFNKKYDRHGPLFSGRFKSKIIQKERYFLELSRYIHLNPVKANLTSQLEGYRYSSLREYAGKAEKPIINLARVTKLLGKTQSDINSYLQFVRDGIEIDLEELNPFYDNKQILGSRKFATHRRRI